MPKIQGQVLFKISALIIGVVLLTLWLLSLYRSDASIAREHGPMENVQAVLLSSGVLLLALFAVAARERGDRYVLGVASLVYLTFLLLEYDVRPFKKPLLSLLLNGAVRNAWVGLAWIGAGWCVWCNRGKVWLAIQRFRRTFAALLLVAAGVFWVTGAASEKLGFSEPKTFFLEELFETHAAVLMVLSAVSARTAFRSVAAIPRGQRQPGADAISAES